jgi:hypothetical protein
MSTQDHIQILLAVECHAERLADIDIIEGRLRGIEGTT